MRDENTVIVGAGPIGLAAAVSAKRRGVDPLVIDAGSVCDAIRRYPIGMTFFTTPERLEIGGHPIVCSGQKPTREEALKYYRGVARVEGIRTRTFTRLTAAERDRGAIRCELARGESRSTVTCERLVLATGYFDTPRYLGVPGEERDHVKHYFDEAHNGFGLDVVVVGGRNSAVEAALELFRAGARVSIIYRRPEFPRNVKYWLKPDIENRIRAGEIAAYLGAQVTGIEADSVHVRCADGTLQAVPAQRVYALTGFEPEFELFERIGIELDTETRVPTLDPETYETNVEGVYMVGSITRGRQISDVFIENGRFDGERVFGDAESRRRAQDLYRGIQRAYGE